MTVPDQNSPDALRDEIFAEAAGEMAEINRRAQRDAETVLAAANAGAAQIHREKIAAARAEAERRHELMLATIPVETGRMRAARTEAILESIRAGVLRRLETPVPDDLPVVATLAAAAIRHMGDSGFLLKISPADQHAFGERLAAEVQRLTGRNPLKLAVVADTTVPDGGVMVTNSTGTQVWDNRPAARLERLWPELRRQIARQTALVEAGAPAGGVT